ncbi:MAG TPA: outer membrane protein assembly factor BamD [Candidatus Binatia bacterium]|nr:outer membrane protein assembly factor BamD [Candidatus Binatia bacterium]
MDKRALRARSAAVLLAASLILAACGKKEVAVKAKGADTTQEPDKVLYEHAMAEIKSGHDDVARLTLKTLLNTYPDSEYVAKAKLAIADSYYNDGGTEGLAQAIAEYKDFETFFPYLEEASYAQYRVAMAHYRQMEKPDRDTTQAQLAEQEFQTYLLKFPQGPQAAEAAQRLREVQEVLAEGDYRVAQYYYRRGSYHASAARLTEIVDRYPLYSNSDQALWMLAQASERYEATKHYAAEYYARIDRDYPLSPYAAQAKKKLEEAGYPVPQPNPQAVARMEEEKKHEKERPGMFKKSLGMVKTGPDVSAAAHSGTPQMNSPGEDPGNETLGGGSGQTSIVASGGGVTGSNATPVRTVTPTETVSAAADSGADASEEPAADVPKQPALADQLPNHDDGSAKKREQKKEESSSKKKSSIWKIIPF